MPWLSPKEALFHSTLEPGYVKSSANTYQNSRVSDLDQQVSENKLWQSVKLPWKYFLNVSAQVPDKGSCCHQAFPEAGILIQRLGILAFFTWHPHHPRSLSACLECPSSSTRPRRSLFLFYFWTLLDFFSLRFSSKFSMACSPAAIWPYLTGNQRGSSVVLQIWGCTVLWWQRTSRRNTIHICLQDRSSSPHTFPKQSLLAPLLVGYFHENMMPTKRMILGFKPCPSDSHQGNDRHSIYWFTYASLQKYIAETKGLLWHLS